MENPNCGELDRLEKTLVRSSLSPKVRAIIRAMIEASDTLRNKIVALVPIDVAQQVAKEQEMEEDGIFHSAILVANVGYIVLGKDISINLIEREVLRRVATPIQSAKYAIIIF